MKAGLGSFHVLCRADSRPISAAAASGGWQSYPSDPLLGGGLAGALEVQGLLLHELP
jgi:hypothetical protein